MSGKISLEEYERQTAATRDSRMDWWRRDRFGMFVHFGIFSVIGRHEWAMIDENIPVEEYAGYAEKFLPKPGAPREWAKLARAAGMKYMVMTTRHLEGFSLWDSKVNPFNSVNYGPHRDIVREFVDACREFDLKIGFYSTLTEWRHPDSALCATDETARRRFTKYLTDLNTELLTNYGKIDILWYDMPDILKTAEAWDSVERNRYMRRLQPDIIINDRSAVTEDFGTPEESIRPGGRDWESCMTFNGLSWGYVDSAMAAPYSFTAQQIIGMLNNCAANGGNLLLNIGPAPDGSVPAEAVEPLTTVGKWLEANGEAVYGNMRRKGSFITKKFGGNGVSKPTAKGNHVYLWNKIWPRGGTMGIGGYMEAPRSVTLLQSGTPVDFEFKGQRIILKDLPPEAPDKIAGVTVIDMEFDREPEYIYASYYPQMHGGVDYAGDMKI